MICRNIQSHSWIRFLGSWSSTLTLLFAHFWCFSSIAAEKKPLVLTTFLPAYSLAAGVAGDYAKVENLAPGKVGVHEFDLAPRDLKRLASADVIILNGLGLESWMERSLAASGAAKRAQLVELASGIPQSELIPSRRGVGESHGEEGGAEHGHGHGGDWNAHVWLDPQYMAGAVSNIVAVLERVHPPAAWAYHSNGTALVQRLLALDREMAEATAPIRKVPFVTLHDAYPYLVRRYQLRQVGVVREIPDVEPSPRHLGELMRTMRDTSVKVLFTEPNTPARVTRQLSSDTGTRVVVLDTLEAGTLGRDAYELALRGVLQTLQRELGTP